MCCPQSPTPSYKPASGQEAFLGIVNGIREVSFFSHLLTSSLLHYIRSLPQGCVQWEMEIDRNGSVLSSACSCHFLAFSLLVLPNSVSTLPPKTTVGVYLLTYMLLRCFEYFLSASF